MTLRTCYSCNVEFNNVVRGRPLCDECRIKNKIKKPRPHVCHRCGVWVEELKSRGAVVCDGCRWKSTDRPRVERICSKCGHHYRTTSGATICSRCKHQDAKHPCAKCGQSCDMRATYCRDCDLTKRRGRKWGSGRYENRGYVFVRTENHPRGLYIREHILVMEEHIGRYLFVNENVHHVNGTKNDNRLENLELWVKSQPSGQRVEDLLSWAHEIIERYEPA